MAGMSARRPIPAIIFILALSLLSALVWWRVLNRDDATSDSKPKPSASATTCATPTTKPIVWPKPATVTVNVLNATNTTGLAATVTTKLKARGFKVGTPDDDKARQTGAAAQAAVTEVRYGSKAVSAARLVQLYLPSSKLVAATNTSAAVTVSVGSTFKDLSTAAQVTKALATRPTIRTC